jgi:hypothetical protein
MNINQFLNLGVNGLLKGIVQNGSCIEFRVEVKFGNNEVKMLKNQTITMYKRILLNSLKMVTMNHKINVHYEINKK